MRLNALFPMPTDFSTANSRRRSTRLLTRVLNTLATAMSVSMPAKHSENVSTTVASISVCSCSAAASYTFVSKKALLSRNALMSLAAAAWSSAVNAAENTRPVASETSPSLTPRTRAKLCGTMMTGIHELRPTTAGASSVTAPISSV